MPTKHGFTYASERKKESTSYYTQCIQSILLLLHMFTSKISFFFLLIQDPLTNDITTLLSNESTDDSSLISDESSVDSDENDADYELESHAALTIQGAWCKLIKKETVRRNEQHEIESRSSQIITNACRTWCKKLKAKKEESAALIIQDAWLSWIMSWIIAEKKRRQMHDEDIAVRTIQLRWRKYETKVSKMIALEEKEAKFTCCQNMSNATKLGLGFGLGSHVFLNTFTSH